MSGKNAIRVVLDAALTIMVVFEMFIQFTGEFLHELIGFAFFATVVAHLLLSAKWIKNTARNARKGEMNRRRRLLAIMGALLAINILVLAVSSIAISNLLADAGFVWALGSYATWATVHAVSSYSLCALVVLHLGMHWIFLVSALHIPYNPERRRAIGTGVNAVAAAGAIALGLMAVNEVIPSPANANSTNQNMSNGASSNGSSSSASGSGQTQPSSRKDKTDTAPVSSSNSTGAQNSNEPSSDTGGGAVSNSANASSSSETGICTLCRKRCPLSAPQCNKPYEAGLI